MSKTEQNLAEAFAGESQANRKYLAFAKQAEQEGYKQVAKLFRAAAAAETVHAHSHLRTMKGVNSTVDNLQEAIAGETHEFKNMYPAMIEAAKAEDEKAAIRSFTFANEVEKIHAALYEKALSGLENLEETDYYVCSVCGYTVEGAPPDDCPVCQAKAKAFFKAD
jgi:rubrerythrin